MDNDVLTFYKTLTAYYSFDFCFIYFCFVGLDTDDVYPLKDSLEM
jgi:hypothetical protein